MRLLHHITFCVSLTPGLFAIKLVSETGEQGLSILVFAALPVTLLTALSKSELGQVWSWIRCNKIDIKGFSTGTPASLPFSVTPTSTPF